MTPTTTAVIAVLATIALLCACLPIISVIEGKEHWYDEGWADCERAHNQFGMTPDDEAVLKHLKFAFKAYIAMKGYRRRGDIKNVDRIENFEDFKHLVWEICIERKVK